MLNWKAGAAKLKEREAEKQVADTKPRLKVMIVEDERVNRESLQAILSEEYEVVTAEDGVCGLETVEEHPDIQVVVTDHRMPRMTGVELCVELEKRNVSCTKVMLTGYAELNSMMKAVNEASIFRYLTKPVEPDSLVAVVKEAVAHHQVYCEKRRFMGMVKDLLETQAVLVKRLELAGADSALPSKGGDLLSETQKLPLTVMFVDIRGFTSYTASTSASRVMAVLQSIFTQIHNIIYSTGGVVDKHLGDGLMAVFGLSGGDGISAGVKAVKTIVESYPAIKDSLNDLESSGLKLSVGLAAGEVVVGMLGTNQRSELAVIGQPANLAARLQEFSKLALDGSVGADALGPFEHAMGVVQGDLAQGYPGFSQLDLASGSLKVRDFRGLESVGLIRS